MGVFARGKHSVALCDRCGQRYPYEKLKPQIENRRQNGMRVCPTCLDDDHPQLQLGSQKVYDPQALRFPRPDRVEPASTIAAFLERYPHTAGVTAEYTTYTVTVASGTNSYGTGNKYFIAGLSGASPTLTLNEGSTYRFDQSDASNSGHPLRFSTTANGTHGSGSEYTTGVTTNGTPGSAGAFTQIAVASDAPTLYYYCTNHSGMGGTANTP
jgi:hypothetical protein